MFKEQPICFKPVLSSQHSNCLEYFGLGCLWPFKTTSFVTLGHLECITFAFHMIIEKKWKASFESVLVNKLIATMLI